MDRPSVPVARLADGTPFQPLYDDVYCSRSGAAQAREVFVEGTGLPGLLAAGGTVTVLETGFGLGLNAAAALDAALASEAPARLRYVSIELHPPAPEDLARAHADLGVDGAEGRAGAKAVRALYGGLVREGRAAYRAGQVDVELELVLGDGATALGGLELVADALFLDGFSPTKNPELWNDAVYAELARLARPGATLATYTVARAVRDGLERAGFTTERLAGFGHKRHRLVGRRR